MITNRHLKYFITLFLSPFLISGLLLHPTIITFSHAASNITSDGTMGTTINQAGNIYNINGGTIKGTNQFHSFGLFSVGTGDTASFNGPVGITNIIGRVTGGQQSIIDGILRSTITGANLYLLNPYGVLFGPNATLDVSGSFHVSTADYLRLSEGGIFYSSPLKSSVLTTAPPVAFGFLSNNPAPISIQDSYLGVPEGKTLSIIGGDINITGGPTGWFWAPSGRINIASVASPGEVIPVESLNAPDLQMSSFDRVGNINLLNWAYLDVSSSSGNGTVVIRGGKLLIENSYIVANTLGEIDGAKVGIDIGLKEDFVANGGFIQAATTGKGQGGDVVIQSGSIEMKNFQINASAFGEGDAGSLIVTANNIFIDGTSGFGVGMYTDTFGSGNSGNINITTHTLEMRGGAQISAGTRAEGQGGSLNINADQMILSGIIEGFIPTIPTGLYTGAQGSGSGGDLCVTSDSLLLTDRAMIYSASTGSGNAGNVQVNAGNLQVLNGGSIIAGTFGSGDGGNIVIDSDSVLVSGVHPELFVDSFGNQYLPASGIASQTYTNGGNAGNVQVTTGSLQLLDGGRISTETFGDGNGGTIQITANNVLISGVNVQMIGFMTAIGADTKLASSAVRTSSNGSYLGSGAKGDGGNLLITAHNLQVQDGGLIFSETDTSGNGGNIELITGRMNLFNGGMVSAESSGSGYAGNIGIQVGDTLMIKNSSITTEAKYTDGGNIHIHAGYMVNLIDSRITASVGGGPQTTGGNITIDPQYVILNDSQIIANAYEGKGGNIRIIADVFLATPDSVVDASSALGIDGTVDIQAPIQNISGTLAPIQENFLSAEALLRDHCIAKIRGEKSSSFVVSGRDGLPIRPGSVLPSPIY